MWKFWYTAIKDLNFASFKFKSENIVKSNKSNLIEEKRLPEEVQKLPCLYDKGSEGFKKQKKKKTCGLGWRIPSATTKLHKLNHKGTLDSRRVLLKRCSGNFYSGSV